MSLLRRLYGKLHLKINESKSAVSSVFNRRFLGYAFWVALKGEVKYRVSGKAQEAFKRQIRVKTRRSGGRSINEVIGTLRSYILGWKNSFGLSQTPKVWRSRDEWIRHRLRALQLKQWKRGKTIYRELRAMGATDEVAQRAAGNGRRWWRNSRQMIHVVMTIDYFDRLGLPRLA